MRGPGPQLVECYVWMSCASAARESVLGSADNDVCPVSHCTILNSALQSRMKCGQLLLVDRSTLECVSSLLFFFFFCMKRHYISFVEHTLPGLLHFSVHLEYYISRTAI